MTARPAHRHLEPLMPTTPDRPADLLRAAAQKLRAAAANATEGAWAIWRDLDHQGYITVGNAAGVVTPPALQSAGEECNPVAHVYVEEDAEHIALLHPGVGLALADLLDRHVKEYDASVVAAANVWPNSADEAARWLAAQVPPEALAVARQLLGTTSEDDDTLHACPGRWAGPNCSCFDVEASVSSAPADLLRAAAVRAWKTGDPLHTALAQLLDGVMSTSREADHEECQRGCSPEICDLSAALAVARQLLGATSETTAPEEREPIQLRWGLDDVMYGDDDTITVLLSGPGREPYWVELDPERTAALRDALAGPESTALPAPADRAATRDRIRRAICEASGFDWDPDTLEPDEYGEHADAVLAVLDTPADRAAVLRERADFYDQWLRDSTSPDSDPRYCQAVHDIALGLRRLAGEAAAGAHHPEQADTDQTEGPEAAARRFARRLHAVERLCSGRPGYHTITVKTLLTAMSEADDETPAAPAAPEETQ